MWNQCWIGLNRLFSTRNSIPFSGAVVPKMEGVDQEVVYHACIMLCGFVRKGRGSYSPRMRTLLRKLSLVEVYKNTFSVSFENFVRRELAQNSINKAGQVDTQGSC